MSNGRRIILPGEEGAPLFPGPLDLEAKVTRGEMSKIMDAFTKELAQLSVKVRVHRVRFEALLKQITHDPDSAFDIVGPSDHVRLRFKLDGFHKYVGEYAEHFAPAHNAILSGKVTVKDRVEAAQIWNVDHPKMPITAEELKLAELVEVMRRPLTEDEKVLPLSLPHTETFAAGWQAVIAMNAEMHPN